MLKSDLTLTVWRFTEHIITCFCTRLNMIIIAIKCYLFTQFSLDNQNGVQFDDILINY